MPYDELGNYYHDGSVDNSVQAVAPDNTETEEERRKRLAAEANPTPTFSDNFKQYMNSQLGLKLPSQGQSFQQNFNTLMGGKEAPATPAPDDVVHKQQVVTRADGSQTHTTTQEMPAGTAFQPAPPQTVQAEANGNFTPVAPSTTVQPAPQATRQAEASGNFSLNPQSAQAYPVQAPQQVIAGPAYQGAGAGRGVVNPAPVAPQAPVQTSNNAVPLINNNPGNIMYGPYAQKMGATGARPNGTAIFPDQQAGENAQDNLLSSSGYANYSIKDIPQRWAPAGHGNNNPVAYGESLQKLTGFDDATMGKRYNELTPGEKATYRQAMARMCKYLALPKHKNR